jgi:hypothetical protein
MLQPEATIKASGVEPKTGGYSYPDSSGVRNKNSFATGTINFILFF